MNDALAILAPLADTQDPQRVRDFLRIAHDALSQEGPSLTLCPSGNGVTLNPSGERTGGFFQLSDVLTALTLLATVNLRLSSKLTWTSSNVIVEGSEAATLLKAWRDGRRPPTMSVIGFAKDFGDGEIRGHHTRGLAAFVGHELSVETQAPDGALWAIQTLVAAAGWALVLGPAYVTRAMHDAHGRRLKFAPAGLEGDAPVMVNITF